MAIINTIPNSINIWTHKPYIKSLFAIEKDEYVTYNNQSVKSSTYVSINSDSDDGIPASLYQRYLYIQLEGLPGSPSYGTSRQASISIVPLTNFYMTFYAGGTDSNPEKKSLFFSAGDLYQIDFLVRRYYTPHFSNEDLKIYKIIDEDSSSVEVLFENETIYDNQMLYIPMGDYSKIKIILSNSPL